MSVGVKRLGSRADETLRENLERFTALGLDERDGDKNQEREERRHERVDASEILESLLFAGVRIPSVRGSLVKEVGVQGGTGRAVIKEFIFTVRQEEETILFQGEFEDNSQGRAGDDGEEAGSRARLLHVKSGDERHNAASKHDIKGDNEQVASGSRRFAALVETRDDHGDKGERNRGDASEDEQVLLSDPLRRHTEELRDVANDVVREHGAERENSAVTRAHGCGNDTQQAPTTQKLGCDRDEKLQEGLTVGLPHCASRQVKYLRARVRFEFGVDGIRTKVVSRDSTHVRERDADEEGHAAGDDATDTGGARGLGSHASGLEIKRSEVTKAENKDGRPVEEDGVRERRQSPWIGHLVFEDRLVTERVRTVVRNTVVRIRAVERSVVAHGTRLVGARDTVIQRCGRVVRIDVSVKADGRRRGRLLGVLDQPEDAREATKHTDGRLDDVGVSDGVKTTTSGVNQDDGARNEDTSGHFDVKEEGEDGSHTDQVTRE